MILLPQRVLEAARKRICIRTSRPLTDGENLLSHASCGSLYSAGAEVTLRDAEYLGHVLEGVRAALKTEVSDPERREIGAFLATAFERGVLKKEEHLHLYLYAAWDEPDLWGDEEPIRLGEKYLECDASESSSGFAQNVVMEIRRRGSYFDIVGFSRPSHGELVVVEVKIGDVDDRAVGQMLRYYNLARNLCDHQYHGCDIRRVRPVLIAKGCDMERWLSFPLMFRECMSLFFFRKRKGKLVLVDGKRIIETEQRQRLSGAGSGY
ncbi:MAG: hypothetical protein JWP01_2516 [Myxococcales bacterium]|nr:hypothetical protein [Myxococcales bacterium]